MYAVDVVLVANPSRKVKKLLEKRITEIQNRKKEINANKAKAMIMNAAQVINRKLEIIYKNLPLERVATF